MKGRFTLSDDSHGVEQLGTKYDRALQFSKTTSIQQVFCFEPGPSESGGRLENTTLRAVGLEELEKHKFWHDKR